MANQLIGSVLAVTPTVPITSKSGTVFNKRELVLSIQRFDPNTGQPYSDQSNTPSIQFIGDKCQMLDALQLGQMVVVSFDVQGRSVPGENGTTKYFNSIVGYKIEPYGVQRTHNQPQQVQQSAPAPQPQMATPQVVPQGYPPQQPYYHQTASAAMSGQKNDLPF